MQAPGTTSRQMGSKQNREKASGQMIKHMMKPADPPRPVIRQRKGRHRGRHSARGFQFEDYITLRNGSGARLLAESW